MNIYYGEKNCQGIVSSTNNTCTNKAYFKLGDKLLCGVHSRKHHNSVIKLPKNPNKNKIYQDKIKQMKDEVDKFAKNNKTKGLKGQVQVSKLQMMKSPIYIKGYLNVFPNYKHQNRKDGYGCMKLSPKSLGPINHNMPGLPIALNLENYHQFAKFWKFELDENNQIIEKFKQERIEAYQDSPKRHKYNKSKLLKYNNNVNIPEFSVYYDKDGKEHRYGYLECRYFYCHFYELLAKKEPDFIKIKDMIKNGVNINIQGFDGYNVTSDLWDHYNDISKPFGHELVLYTILIEDNPSKYPWNRFYKENKIIYHNVI